MATAALQGSATITYTPPSSAAVVHTLAVPFKQIRPVDRLVRFDWWAQDLTTREVVSLAFPVYEVRVTIRFENEPDLLKALLSDALRYDLELVYADSSGSFPVHLVSIEGAGTDDTPLEPDRDRYGFGEWECTIQLRRIDGGTLDTLIS